MPGVFQYSVDRLEEVLERVKEAGIGGIMLFGIPIHKDPQGSQAYAEDGVTLTSSPFRQRKVSGDLYCCGCMSV